MKQVDLARLWAIAPSTSRYERGIRVSPNSDSRCGRSSSSNSVWIRWHAVVNRSAGLGRPIRVLSRRHSSGCQPSAPSLAGCPGAQHVGAVHPVVVGQVGDVVDHAEAVGGVVGAPARALEVLGQHRQPRLGEALVHDAPAAATPTAPAATDPGRARFPWRPTPRRGSAGPGNGKSTFAQTPSARPAVVPSRVESRCVSHRSIPRVGTAMISGAKGSSSGSSSVSARPSARRSARSARWT